MAHRFAQGQHQPMVLRDHVAEFGKHGPDLPVEARRKERHRDRSLGDTIRIDDVVRFGRGRCQVSIIVRRQLYPSRPDIAGREVHRPRQLSLEGQFTLVASRPKYFRMQPTVGATRTGFTSSTSLWIYDPRLPWLL